MTKRKNELKRTTEKFVGLGLSVGLASASIGLASSVDSSTPGGRLFSQTVPLAITAKTVKEVLK